MSSVLPTRTLSIPKPSLKPRIPGPEMVTVSKQWQLTTSEISLRAEAEAPREATGGSDSSFRAHVKILRYIRFVCLMLEMGRMKMNDELRCCDSSWNMNSSLWRLAKGGLPNLRLSLGTKPGSLSSISGAHRACLGICCCRSAVQPDVSKSQLRTHTAIISCTRLRFSTESS